MPDELIDRLGHVTGGRMLTPAGQAGVDRDAAVIRDDARRHGIDLGDPDVFRAVVFGATSWAHLSGEHVPLRALLAAPSVVRDAMCRVFVVRVLLVLADRARRNERTPT